MHDVQIKKHQDTLAKTLACRQHNNGNAILRSTSQETQRLPGAYRGAVYKVVDIVEGHSKGREGQHHPLLHIALLETVASLAHAAAGALQLLCRQPISVKRPVTIQQIGRPATLSHAGDIAAD